MELWDRIQEAARFVQTRWSLRPHAGIILGTGLGGLAQRIAAAVTIPYEEIPHFARSTAIGHAGQLVCGTIGGLPVVAMEGRFHIYEGYSYQQVTFPVRVMRALGADLLIVSNAAGGLNPHYARGDIVVITDHINLMNGNPLIGPNDDRLGPRFPDMIEPYDRRLIDRALEIARQENFVAHKGVYIAVTGPNLETRAEYRFMRLIGRRCSGHVHGSGGDRGGSRRDEGAGTFCGNGYVPAGCAGAHQPPGDLGHRGGCRTQAAEDCLGNPGR